ncbi:MAG: hypothetical protein HQM10_14110 [Candidatus Riflebacteria bacterium]|nr:hypothetical protein [Candidatus Riflebacteria bacterium]
MTIIQPISSITQRATNTLIKELGIVDTIRFLNQFRAGTGNYTEERHQLFKDMSVKEIIREIKAQRSEDTGNSIV